MMRSLAVYFALPCSLSIPWRRAGGQAVEPGPAWSPVWPAVDKATVPMAGEGLEAAFRTLLWSAGTEVEVLASSFLLAGSWGRTPLGT